RRARNFFFVVNRELRFRLVAEHHRRQVLREGAHGHVKFLHRLDVAVARDSADVSSPWACWNFWNAPGSFTSSGVGWMLPTFARALVTPSSTSFSCWAKPLTVFTRLGTRSARRWY